MINFKNDSDLKRMSVSDLKQEVISLDISKQNFDNTYELYVLKLNTMIRYRQLWCGDE